MREACLGIELVGRATVRGALYDLGQFPGVVEGEGTVRGVVLRVPPTAWTALDEYEACPGPEHPHGLFHRIKTRAKMRTGGTGLLDLRLCRDVSGFSPSHPAVGTQRESRLEYRTHEHRPVIGITTDHSDCGDRYMSTSTYASAVDRAAGCRCCFRTRSITR
jgi:hypothetical protein